MGRGGYDTTGVLAPTKPKPCDHPNPPFPKSDCNTTEASKTTKSNSSHHQKIAQEAKEQTLQDSKRQTWRKCPVINVSDFDGEDDTYTPRLKCLVDKCTGQNDPLEGLAEVDGVHTPPYTTVVERQMMSQTMEDFSKISISKVQDGLEIEKNDENRLKDMSNLDISDNIKQEETSDENMGGYGCTRSEDQFERNTAGKHASKCRSIEVRSTVSKMAVNPTGTTLHSKSWDPSRPYEQGFKDSLPNTDNLTEKAIGHISSPRLPGGPLQPFLHNSVEADVHSKTDNPTSQSASGLPALIEKPNSMQPQQASPKESVVRQLYDSSQMVSSPRGSSPSSVIDLHMSAATYRVASISVMTKEKIESETESGWSSQESDSESEESDHLSGSSSQDSSFGENETLNGIMISTLSPIQQAMVERIMEHFWVKFQEWTSNNYKHASGTTTSAYTESPNDSVPGTTSTQLTNKRSSDDEPTEEGGNNNRAPKRPRNNTKVRQERNKALDFACHFKKHNPRKYNIDEFRSCCLGHWGTVGRVKEHLYRRHQLPPQCPRCYQQFESQEKMQAHCRLAVSCELQLGREREGITVDVEKQLKSRKKTSPGQSEADRWRDIYRILFPREPVPSPYFDPIQDDYENLSASRDFLNYETYARRELPRRFRQSLEAIVTAGIQPIEDQIIAQMEDLIRNCQEETFSSYRLQYSLAEQTVPINAGQLNLGDEQLPQHQPEQEKILADENSAAPRRDQDPPEDVGPVIPNPPAQDITQYGPGVTLSVASNDPPDTQGNAVFSYPGNDTDRLMCSCSCFCICPRNPTNQYLRDSQIHVTPNIPMIPDIEPTIAITEEAMFGDTLQVLVESNDNDIDWGSYLD